MENKKSISERWMSLFYLMSRLEQIAIHAINYNELQKKLDEKLKHQKSQNTLSDKYDYSEKLSKLEISEKIKEKMIDTVNDIILPMLKSNRTRMYAYFEQKLPSFMNYCLEIDHLNYMLNPETKFSYSNDIQQLESARKRIENKKLDKRKSHDSPIKNNILSIIDRLILHFQKMDILTKQNLEESLWSIDFDNLKKSLFATLLMYVCIMIVLHPKNTVRVSRKTFNEFTFIGSSFAKELNAYTDQLMKLVGVSIENIHDFKITESAQVQKMEKKPLSDLELQNIEDNFRKYKNGEIDIDGIFPILCELRDHFKIRYNIKTEFVNIFEDLAFMIQKILTERNEIHNHENSLDFKAIKSILILDKITPLDANVDELLPVILNLNIK